MPRGPPLPPPPYVRRTRPSTVFMSGTAEWSGRASTMAVMVVRCSRVIWVGGRGEEGGGEGQAGVGVRVGVGMDQ